MSATVRVNGATMALPSARLSDLLHALGVDPARRGVAIAVDGAVVPRTRWDAPLLAGGEEIDIVRPLQGG
ncbi:MAG TPA: sulfur carrier protein ThiS [Candidatus Sulfotelmatobacter sp.]|nr:sulfur carrier protein ThiS [Candidatus Sulfotelmatobacter sp.]